MKIPDLSLVAHRRGFALALFCGALTGLFPATVRAWSRVTHADLAAEALPHTAAFRQYVTTHGLTEQLLQGVKDADNQSEMAYVAALDQQYPGIRMIRGDDPTKVQHTTRILCHHMPDDSRLHNALECLRLAIDLKKGSPTPEQRRESMRIFANGLHLVQDYFAHLHAPGRGTTNVPHGVTNLVDTDRDGQPDTAAGRLVDKINWDCHSDVGNDLVPPELKVVDYFHSPFWHYHEKKEDSWRYQAALESCIEYMEAFMDEGPGAARFEKTLAKGYVVRGGVKTWLDLITHIVVDNSNPQCALAGEWEASTDGGGYYLSDFARAKSAGAATSAKWTPVVPLAGRYQVYLRWPASPGHASAATLTVSHAGGTSTQVVDLRANGNRWNLLGTHQLAVGRESSIALSAASGHVLVADALLLVRVAE